MPRLALPLSARLAASLLGTSIALLGMSAAHAQAQKVRPGLWENSVTMKSTGGQAEAAMAQMRDQLARMPPEQRAQVEAMMARQGVAAGAKPNSVRTCISPEMASRDEFNPGDGRCKSTGHSRSGNIVRFKFVCSGEGSTGEGEGEFTLVSATETKGKMFVNTTRQGQSLRMEMESNSRWVGESCGDVKPVR